MNKESQQPQHQQSRHHERAIIKAIVVIAAVVITGFLMARYVEHAFKGKPGNAAETRIYNGFEFVKSEGSWYTEWQSDSLNQPIRLRFQYAPWEVENITVKGSVDNRFKRWPTVFITYDPEDNVGNNTKYLALAAADTATFLSSPIFERNVFGACTRNITDDCTDKPIITCSTNTSVVYLKISSETGILLDGNCVTFQGKGENLRKTTQKAIYQWLGIIKK